MAAPATTARVAPTGIRLTDGFKTTIAFARKSNINLWEKEPKPPGLDGGDAIETTTMLNSTWRTMAPRQLTTLTKLTGTFAYDPGVYADILSVLLNQPGAITVHYPDGSTLDFYGYLEKFEPQSHKEGDMPLAECTVTPTNFDPVNHVEAAPVVTATAGT